MKNLRILSASEQLADFLKQEIGKRTWIGTMPGESRLVAQLMVGRDTVRAAMVQLEEEGVISSQGQGQRRRIVMGNLGRQTQPKHYRVGLLLHSSQDRHIEEIHEVQSQLTQRGYEVEIAPKGLIELGMKVERVAKIVGQIKCDAWVAFAASYEVLEWLAARPVPAFAVFGRFPQTAMATMAPSKLAAYQEAVRRLMALGHRRIVFLMPENARKPMVGRLPQALFGEMQAQGITTSSYNLPDWEPGPAGLRKCLDRLFGLTPPTALFVEEACEFIAVQQHLAKRGIFAPRDISLICSDDNPLFKWCEPSVSCIRWSFRPIVNRVIRWVDNVAAGKVDKRRVFTDAKFIEAGTVGPVPRQG